MVWWTSESRYDHSASFRSRGLFSSDLSANADRMSERAVDRLASRQYGTFSRQQALHTGMSPTMIRNRLASGAWIRLAPSVYALASAPATWERQLEAAVLNRKGAIVAGRSAAHLHQFPGFSPSRPVIMIGLDGRSSSPLARVIRSQRFETIGRVRKLGFVLTDEAETLMTLARDLREDRLEALVDFLIARNSVTAAQLARVVYLGAGVPGVTKLRRIVAYRLPDAYQPPTSELERLLFPVLDDPRLPPYTRQMPMSYQEVEATVDAYIGLWRLIVEGDGRRWHTRRADMERDRVRDNEAVANGYAVLRFTYEMLRDSPEKVIDTLLRTGQVRQAS